jgi:protein SCO1/2
LNTESSNPPVIQPPTTKRRRLWGILALLAVFAVALFAVWLLLGRNAQPEHGILLDATSEPADFTLDSSLGRPVSLADYRGKHTLLYFGYTFCPDVCPTTLADLRMMMAALGDKAKDLQVLFVSVDPERDTPERLGAYLSAFDPSFVGLTGTPEEIEPIASKFGIFYQKHEADSAAGYLVDHTSVVIVVDPEGRPRLIFPHGTTGEQMAEDMGKLIGG